MKSKYVLPVLALFITILSASFASVASATPPAPATITVVAPNGGEVYTEGDTVTIRWTTSQTTSNIWLGYSSGPGNLNWIATGLANTGSYTWNVNVGNTTNTQFKIYITGTAGRGTVEDYSNNFFTVFQSFPGLTFTADSTSIPYNASTTLRWTATQSTSCTAGGSWSGSRPLTGTYDTGLLTSSRGYSLTCTSPFGSVTKNVFITVAPPPAPTLVFTADNPSVPSGGATTLRWTATNATTCTASGGWSGSRPTTGTYPTGALFANRTYNLLCSGSGGSTSRSVTVIVTPPLPTVLLTADSTNISYNASTTLRWSSTNATSCTAAGAWSGAKPLSGSQDTGWITSTRTYELGCTGAGGTATSTVTVTVAPAQYPVPTLTFTADSYAITSGSNTTLRWSTTDASTCVASRAWSGTVATSGSFVTGNLTSDRSYALYCTNPENVGVYRTLEVNVYPVVNIVPFAGTLQEALDSGRELNCVNWAYSDGKGPDHRHRYYFGQGRVRSESEQVRPDGSFMDAEQAIFVPGTVLYEFYNNAGPVGEYYPGHQFYESFAQSMTTYTLGNHMCNEAPLDPALFVPPTN